MATDEETKLLGRVVGYHADRTLTGEQVAARISAYLYGNIIVFATLVPLDAESAEHGHALQLVAGVAASTYLAHVFAEIVGHHARAGAAMTRTEVVHELRDSLPIASSALVPALLFVGAWLGWYSVPTAVLISEGYLLIRLASIGLLVQRLRDVKPSLRTLRSGLLLGAVAAGIALLKVALGH